MTNKFAKMIWRGTTVALIAVIAACGGRDAATGDTTTVRVKPDSASGEVAQYALMKNSVGWLTDSNLVSLASTVNQAPINLARVETETWANEQIHAFALEILRDHASLQVAIDSLAAKRRIPPQRPAVAAGMQAAYDSAVTAMAMLPVAERESKLIDAIIALHTRTVTDFAAIAGNAADPDLRALFASRAILMEQTHTSKARLIAVAVAKADSARQAERGARKR